MELQDVIIALANPANIPGSPASVELRQTHASCAFLTPTDVYKLKKPVNFGFLDYSTLRRRHLMCTREVQLNRRLAPGVYLGVEPLVRLPGGSLAIGGRGETIDYLVHMRRLPDSASLASLLDQGRIGDNEIRLIARRIRAFHDRAPVAPARIGSVTRLRRNTLENVAPLFADGVSEPRAAAAREIWAFAEASLARQAALLRARASAGMVRDLHGDLRCEHVYLLDGSVQIIDCIEFNRSFRMIDVALDLSFLAMDLTANGYPDLARMLVGTYEEASEPLAQAVWDLFGCYRAMVRCKVALLRAGEPEVAHLQRDAALVEAGRFLAVALRYARSDSRPLLVLTGGLTGAGKSTVAGLARDLTGCRVLNADMTRKHLAGIGPGRHRENEYASELYAPEMNRRVYDALGSAAAQELSRGRSIVVDATFRRRDDRVAFRNLAHDHGARFLFVECRAPEAMIHDRLRAREDSGEELWSDGTWAIYLQQRGDFEGTAELSTGEHLALDTSVPKAAQVEQLLGRLMDRS